MGQIKSYYFYKNQDKVIGLIQDLDQENFKPKNHKEISIIKDVFKSFSKTRVALVLLSVLSTFSSISVPLFYPTPQGLPVQSWYPFDISSSPLHQIVYIHQSLAIITISGLNIFTDTLVAGICTFVGLQCDLLCERLRNLEGDQEQLVQCVKYHYDILR
ncbi:hypothetical protein GWI33_012924 [Rhynchophorus ferrugineus]|uniref:Odorant receptor n=1 Tax=Rhynchophorus ferrugineus TaxID=354439 RepID=A0A834I834_RHYFE|nr:hypothetical protein GWI33_012924 [Rhynchophorus ferrugineus]